VQEGIAEYVTDTHPLVWHLWEESKLSGAAKQAFEAVDRGEAIIHIPTICFVEAVFLSESGKIPEGLYDHLIELIQKGSDTGSYRVVPLTLAVATALRAVPRPVIRELPDRVIAATALERGLPLITKDEAIRRWDGITTLW